MNRKISKRMLVTKSCWERDSTSHPTFGTISGRSSLLALRFFISVFAPAPFSPTISTLEGVDLDGDAPPMKRVSSYNLTL
mmetsp:Transcript_69851/g.167693  ORF Transcript_69851/g.167693 Transcript_69851/m.167693 type:complete len:80 (+) Transcript_69851:757-996(+)